MRLVLTNFVPEPPSLQRDGSVGSETGPFVPKVKITSGGSVRVRRVLICFVPEFPVCILLRLLF